MVFLLVFLAMFLLLLAVLRTVLRRHVQLEQRVQEIRSQHLLNNTDAAELTHQERKHKPARVRFNVVNLVAKELNQVGIALSRQEWLVVGAALFLLLFLSLLLGRGNLLYPLVLLAALVIGYKMFIKHRVQSRKKQFEEGLIEMLTVATGALKAGYSLFQAMDTVVKETNGLVSDEFRRVIKEISLGVTVEEALLHAQERSDSLDFELIVNAILIQRQVGGNLAEVLEIAADTIRNRLRMRGEIRALTAQGRMSLWIFLLLTPAIALLMFAFNRAYISNLWSTSTGWLMLAAAFFGQGIGALLIRKIVNFDF